jgi:hypothetical protein
MYYQKHEKSGVYHAFAAGDVSMDLISICGFSKMRNDDIALSLARNDRICEHCLKQAGVVYNDYEN